MAHMKDLHLNILRKILAYFCNGIRNVYGHLHNGLRGVGRIHEFRQLLPLAAVCRVWRECMLRYVYSTAHLEYHVKERDEGNGATRPKYVWKSNIGLIVSQRLSSTVRELRIQSFECSFKITDTIHALDSFAFRSSSWRSVNVVVINTNSQDTADSGDTPDSGNDELVSTELTKYFGQHVPNIGDFRIWITHPSSASRLLSNKLIDLYIHQLHSLYCDPARITFNCHSFSSKLRRLHVGIASGVENRLPQMLASPLEVLFLCSIPHNFAWWTFIGAAPDHIEFSNLGFLCLEFRKPSNNPEPNNSSKQASKSALSFSTGYRKLHFPKLKELRIYDSPYNGGALYSVFVHSPLRTVEINSSFKSVQHMDPRILFNAATIRLNIHSVSPDDYNGYDEFYRRLLGTPSNARTALLSMYQSSVPLPIPSTIEWINLEHLILETNVHLASVIQAITRLPKLHKFEVENVVDEVNESGANLQAILEGRLTQIPSITTNIKSLWIYSGYKTPLVFSLDIMCYLTVLIHSLDEVAVPDLYVSDINEFAGHHANAFPHLHNIKVRGTYRWLGE